jgi:hypothetical protein
VPQTGGIDNLEACYPAGPFIDIERTRLANPVVKISKGDFKMVFFWIVGKPEQRHPLRNDLLVHDERGGLGPPIMAAQSLRETVAEALPFGLSEFP